MLNAVLSSRDNSSKVYELMQSTINPEFFKKIVRMYFQHYYNESVDEYIISSVLDRYIDWKHPKDLYSQSNRAIDFLTDVFFAIPVMDTASAHCHRRPQSLTNRHEITTKTAPPLSQSSTESPLTPGATFVYRFNLPEPKETAIPWFHGTGHASEVNYVFGDASLQEDPEVALSKNVMTYWSNFVKSGNPNKESPAVTTTSPRGTNAIPLWSEYDNNNEYFMELSDKPETKSRMRADYRHFWTQYLPQLKQHMQEVFNEGKQSALAVNHLKPESSGQAMSGSNIFVWVILAATGMALVDM
ncbi:unnamed protein product [Candidula unifasciata]|uniref:Carboxylesterase type B domain-containing protein n=1 Tax=Candidula unifasciata TaxID=100452 RepID=A0A8S3ZMC1_9EUPU|nr:unnamed protein product [Candidula unifasciata]